MRPDIATEVLRLLRHGEDLAWVSIIENVGSSPRHPGSHMFVRENGAIVGTIGGGALEAHAIRMALEVLSARAARLESYTLTADDAAGLGMICGGSGLLLVDHLSHGDPDKMRLLEAVSELLSRDELGSLVTLLPTESEPGWTTERCLIRTADSSLVGTPVCMELGVDTLLGSGIAIVTGEKTLRVYSEAMGARGTAFVFGAGHCGQSLIPLLNTVGFRTVLIDDRPDYANRERFPLADSIVIPPSFDSAMDSLSVDENGYVVILTRGHLHDKTVLRQALDTNACYVGMIGSRRKVAQIFEALRAEGVEEAQLERVHAPIGISIGAETPEEIAVSIAAQLIGIRASADK